MNKSNEIYKSRINRVIDYVNNNLHKSLSLEELAFEADFSPYHFHRVFVAVTGETVNNFTNRLRNEKAARLLRFSKRSVADVALECGFSSSSTLSRLFKQYFEVSPRNYRNGLEIKNSKICKDLPAVSEYNCNINAEEGEQLYPVEIRQLSERRIAYIREKDAFRKGVVLAAFEKLIKWAKATGLFDTQTIFGMSIDDPDVTPKEKYRYEACITLPANLEVSPDSGLETTTLPKCKYAVTRVKGDMKAVGDAFGYLFDSWLINSYYECEPLHGLEIFKDKNNICNWDYFDLELCIPVKLIVR